MRLMASFAATFLKLLRYFCQTMSMRLSFTALAVFFCIHLIAQKPYSLQVAGKDSLSLPTATTINRDTLPKAIQAPPDSLVIKGKKQGAINRFFFKSYPNPNRAALLSLIMPGAGQAYNKKYWKIPIVWGAIGVMSYFTFDTKKTYGELRDAYKIIVTGGTPKAPYIGFDATTLKSYRDNFRSYTEKWYLALGATYLLAVTDAFVDAHLSHFDVSDDLSLRLKPSLETSRGLPVFGLGIALSLSNTHDSQPLTFSQPHP
jgi:Family of unknown function (DUF5683)